MGSQARKENRTNTGPWDTDWAQGTDLEPKQHYPAPKGTATERGWVGGKGRCKSTFECAQNSKPLCAARVAIPSRLAQRPLVPRSKAAPRPPELGAPSLHTGVGIHNLHDS
jgi:hypothetical protein